VQSGQAEPIRLKVMETRRGIIKSLACFAAQVETTWFPFGVLRPFFKLIDMVAGCVVGTEFVAMHRHMFDRGTVRAQSRSYHGTSLFVEKN
jgi:hypothetical protein